jgi:hypothetical protein
MKKERKYYTEEEKGCHPEGTCWIKCEFPICARNMGCSPRCSTVGKKSSSRMALPPFKAGAHRTTKPNSSVIPSTFRNTRKNRQKRMRRYKAGTRGSHLRQRVATGNATKSSLVIIPKDADDSAVFRSLANMPRLPSRHSLFGSMI